MRVLIAPDCFGGTLTADEAAAAVRTGWLRAAPGDEVDVCPLADGGPGFVDTVRACLGGELVRVVVTSPVGARVSAEVLVVEQDGVRTAYVESAQAAGLHLVALGSRDPMSTTTFGVGELVRAAVQTGAGRVVVGLGGSGTNDAGAGMLAALGLGGAQSVLARGGGALADVRAADLAGLAAVRAGLAGIDLMVAVDVDVPLLGLQGASAGFAVQKGASPAQAQELERALGHFARLAVDALADVERPDLLAGARVSSVAARLAAQPGAGAAGGLGFGFALLGARLVAGSALVADAVSLDARIAAVDLVVTGEGAFDWQSLHGKVVAVVAERALRAAVPTIVVAGQVSVGRRELGAAGISAAYAVVEQPDELAASLADPAGALSRRAERVARTWSR